MSNSSFRRGKHMTYKKPDLVLLISIRKSITHCPTSKAFGIFFDTAINFYLDTFFAYEADE